MSKFWTILGAGDLIGDLQDAIESLGDKLKQIVVNQPLPASLLKKISVPVIEINHFSPDDRDSHIFGFLNPNKEPFLDQISKFANLNFDNLVHPKAYISKNSVLGMGNYIGPMGVVASGSKIGNFNFINRAASIGHDVEIENLNHFGPNVTICGKCQIGNKNYFGASSTVIDNLWIRDNIFIGAGGLVINDLETSGKYVGVPVKYLRKT